MVENWRQATNKDNRAFEFVAAGFNILTASFIPSFISQRQAFKTSHPPSNIAILRSRNRLQFFNTEQTPF